MKKVILITGAGSGMAKDAAFELTRRGHSVIATTETEAQATSLKEEVKQQGVNIEVFKLDVTQSADRELVKPFDIDVLVSSAAIGESGSIAEIDMEKVRHNFQVNVFAAFELSQIVLKQMFKKNKGTIVFISSLAGRVPVPFLGPYSMTKFALSAGAATMRTEIYRAGKNVHICLVEPGGYATGFNQRNTSKKYEWMDESSIFHSIINDIKKEEERTFKIGEYKSNKTIVKKIVKASEAKKPKLRYVAPAFQGFIVALLRVFGK